MKTENSTAKTDATEALKLLEQAWAYYTPAPAKHAEDKEPELFEYANAA